MSLNSISFVTVSDDRFGRKDGKYSQTQDQAFNIIEGLGFSNLFFWKWADIISNDFYTKNKRIFVQDWPKLCKKRSGHSQQAPAFVRADKK